MIESDGNKKILWIILILTTFSFFKSAVQHTVGRVVYFLKPICYLWFVEICIRRKWACSPSLATTNNSPSLETDIRRIFSCRLCQAQYSQSVSKIATSSFLAGICKYTNGHLFCTLISENQPGIHPSVRRSPVISHRIMLWSQKFLTLSINIPSISWQSHFFTILTGFPEIWPRPTRHLDFLGSKIAKSTFFQFFQYKSLWFYFKSEWQLFSAFFWGI